MRLHCLVVKIIAKYSHMWHLQLKKSWKKLVVNMQIPCSDKTCNNILQSANIFFKWFK
jgi:hypothetical protein